MDVNSNKQVELQTRLIFQMYLKFKNNELDYELKELFNEAGLANENKPELITAFNYVRNMPEMFTITGSEQPTVDSQVNVILSPLYEMKIIGISNGILEMLTQLTKLETAQKVQLEEIRKESDSTTKMKSLSLFLTSNPGLNLSGK